MTQLWSWQSEVTLLKNYITRKAKRKKKQKNWNAVHGPLGQDVISPFDLVASRKSRKTWVMGYVSGQHPGRMAHRPGRRWTRMSGDKTLCLPFPKLYCVSFFSFITNFQCLFVFWFALSRWYLLIFLAQTPYHLSQCKKKEMEHLVICHISFLHNFQFK